MKRPDHLVSFRIFPKPKPHSGLIQFISKFKLLISFFFFLRIPASLIFYFCFFTFYLNSQQPTEEWVRRYNSPDNMNDNSVDMAIDKLGNVYITGWNNTISEGSNIVTVKYNNDGILQWAKSFNYSTSTNDFPRAIAIDTSGNVYIIGETQLNTGPFDWLLIKYNSNGTEQWVKTYGNPSGGDDSPGSMVIDKMQNIYIAGGEQYFLQNIGGLIIKYNPVGDSIWTKRYRPEPPQPPWALYIGYSRLRTDSIDNIYLGGGVNNTQTLNIDCLVFKYDSSGTLQWMNSYNSGGNRWDNVVDMVIDNNNNVYTTGITALGNAFDYQTLKFNSNGSFAWASVYNSTFGIDYASAIAVDRVGNNIYVTGRSHGPSTNDFDYLTIKYNAANGDSLWVRRFNGGGTGQQIDEANSIAIDSQSNTYITGRSINLTGEFDIATIKYDNDGTQKWVARYPGSGQKVKLDNSINVFVTGSNSEAGTGTDFITIKYSQPVGLISNTNEIPNQFKLNQNYPNPFNPSTKIKFSVPKYSFVQLHIFDVLGREKELLVNESLSPSEYVFSFDGSEYASGIYFYRMIVDGVIVDTKKLVIVK